MDVCTRVAPSPTGDPHVGTAYISLFNWAWAKRNGGRFILRIEDTDKARSKPEHEVAIIAALSWLGIEPDESPAVGGPAGPYRQSERSAIYREHTDTLLASGAAYRCFCTSERLTELRAFQKAAKRPTGYDGLCRSIPADESATRAEKEEHVVRLAVDKAGSTRFTDLLRGEIVIQNENVDDQVLLKSDGMPTYHMANVVDDHLMGVSIIMRAEEWIPSVPKHIMLYAALGWEPPTYAHVPLLRNTDKSKISKRKNPTSLLWYREHGYLPEALVNFLALQGWSIKEDDEEFGVEDFIAKFDPADISVGGPVFDLTKLDWLNGEKIRKLSMEQLADRLLGEGFAGSWERDRIVAVMPLFQDRMKSLTDFVPAARYLVERVEPDMQALVKKVKKADPEALRAALLAACTSLESLDGRPDEEREGALRALAEEHGLKVGALFMGLRVGVTGATASPPLLPSIDQLGTAESVSRVRDLVERLVLTA
jgi:glutamyl-tRNA synthetase